MSDRFVCLVQPSTGRAFPCKGAAKAFYLPTSRNVRRLEREASTSMLTRSFNMLTCEALNHYHGTGGRPAHQFGYLAMLHDDVVPDEPERLEDGTLGPAWLDTMLDELDRTGADLLSSVVPIKNECALTSTAVEVGDFYSPRRLTMQEVMRLPETFTAADVPWAGPDARLLVNTGCWVARFDPAVWEKFVDPEWCADGGRAGWRDWNTVRRVNGEWVAYDQAEDWGCAREFHRLGMKVMATRKVGLYHEHPQYHNRSDWGTWPTDLAWISHRSLLAGGPPAEWRWPEEITGWLTEAEGRALAEVARGKDVLEIGSYLGKSTICMGQTAKLVTAVDPFDGRGTTAPRPCMEEFLENIARHGLAQRVRTCCGTSEQALADLHGAQGETWDVAFVDGAHDYASVRRDAELAAAALRPGGLLCFHDYRSKPGEHDGGWDADVTRLVHEWLDAGWSMEGRAGTIAMLRRAPAPAEAANGVPAKPKAKAKARRAKAKAG